MRAAVRRFVAGVNRAGNAVAAGVASRLARPAHATLIAVAEQGVLARIAVIRDETAPRDGIAGRRIAYVVRAGVAVAASVVVGDLDAPVGVGLRTRRIARRNRARRPIA